MPNCWCLIVLLLPLTGYSASVSLAWDASIDASTVTEYIVKYGTAPGIYTAQESAGLSLSKTISGLPDGFRYYFVVTCKSPEGESEPSNMVTYRKVATNPPVYIVLSAELAEVVSPMEIIRGDDGPFSSYVISTNNDSGTLTFNVNAPYVDDYVIWARILSPDDGHDSFYVSLNNNPEDVYDTVYSYDLNWKWTTVNGRGGTDKPIEDAHRIDPLIFFLTGQDRIRFRGREQYTPIDAIVITNDRGFRPISPPPPLDLKLTVEPAQ